MDSFIKWMGGKSQLRDYIISIIPAHRTYVEPFGGAGWVLMGKPISPVEVFNDINAELINLWTVIRDHSGAFIQWLDKHPVSEQLFYDYARGMGYTREVPEGIPNLQGPIERAAKYYFLIKMAFNGIVREGASFSARPNDRPPFMKFYATEWARIAERLKGVAILARDFEPLLGAYDSPRTAIYLDPPYLLPNGDDYYEYPFKDGDHDRLRDALGNVQGKFILSYGKDRTIEDLYGDFEIIDLGEGEIIITNFKPVKGAFYRGSRPREYPGRDGNWDSPNCPYCGSRDVKYSWERVTIPNKGRSWIQCGFKCNTCLGVYR